MRFPAPVTGFLFAGGRSRRMGQDKVQLPWHGSTLLDLALDKLRAVCSPVRICSNRQDLYTDVPVLADASVVIEGVECSPIGPLGGLLAALEQTKTDWNLFLPVDVPLLPVALLQQMVQKTEASSAWAIVPTLHGKPQPLCAVYHRALSSGLRQAAQEEQWKITTALQSAAPDEVVHWMDCTGAEADRWFLNLNTPRDWIRLQSLTEESAGYFQYGGR